MKFIISGGGTGGHIYPAIAIAQELKAQIPDCEILFVGAEGKMEMEKVPKAGFKIVGLPIRGLQRKLTVENLAFPFKLLQSLWKAWKIVKDFKPDAVIGVGGYASGAVMQVAVWQGIKTLIQEQNSYAGLTNKLVAKSVNKICVAYPNMERYFPKEKIVFCGNPVRKDITDLESIRSEAFKFFDLSENKKTVLVLGGSLGARTINNCLKNGVNELLTQGYQVIWQTGKIYFEEMKAFANTLNSKDLYIKDFIYKMNYAYACADVVISRAGALSVSELCLAGKPTILVPSPNVAEDHQTKNAMALVNENAAVLVRDGEASNTLITKTIELLKDEKRQKELAENIMKLAKPNASREIVNEIVKIVE
ncbi:undecaprenyldiphospho-muramoylpentapeptide beta-N-acetylglucosaminyltransferase [Thermoflexibacter ruber]|uniref:UDP-N-acetylglucosamine--N-acetylmuramyl-(pentapeptide) pyrophosphoryl-undecaprenol N-acetylglucosamine transferase n=1 Tax=Thermoflexibacter ruber TaxID=1003 RepID=A0A1I2HX41_9BACT|nr:undecaprenyldiphospho-muramoylpentapeptide beta-N-acetylglucosaminyltransferase [Thermoflexibacter ruber]SFF33196.1 UDP-N-acetylglucosamine-N-acetylmuramylpentapeptide N-acetylglucosamine transferase [Thermoflexibacter ruber]